MPENESKVKIVDILLKKLKGLLLEEDLPQEETTKEDKSVDDSGYTPNDNPKDELSKLLALQKKTNTEVPNTPKTDFDYQRESLDTERKAIEIDRKRIESQQESLRAALIEIKNKSNA